ncbi:MAG: hypothetical protein DMF69_04760 [Acidobacteria bacterium]|nr:MAG: hypothetical protein DMF69_04760 [Acidobacteriota bacterium]
MRTPNRIEIKTNSNGDSILVLSENYYPGWRVYVDDKAASLIKVNFGLRGVELTGGEHRVSFLYRPWSVMAGLIISLVTGLVLLLLAVKDSLPFLTKSQRPGAATK